MINKESFMKLDALRGISALMVLITHAREILFIGITRYQTIHTNDTIPIMDKIILNCLSITKIGGTFVITFFILSGFAIAHSLNKNKSYSRFLIRRIIRIYPPYILGVVWAFLIYYLLQTSPELKNSGYWFSTKLIEDASMNFGSLNNFIKNLFYSGIGHINGQFWSLGYEIIFYFTAPLYFINYRYYAIASFFLYIIYFMLILFTNFSSQNIFLQYCIHYNFYFFIGIFLYKNQNYLTFDLPKKKLLVVGIIIFLLMSINLLVLNSNIFKTKQFQYYISEIVSVLYSIMLIKYIILYNFPLKVFSFLGKFSYTLYLTHMASIFLFYFICTKFINELAFLENFYSWVIGTTFSIAVAYILFLIAEKPTKIYLDKIREI